MFFKGNLVFLLRKLGILFGNMLLLLKNALLIVNTLLNHGKRHILEAISSIKPPIQAHYQLQTTIPLPHYSFT